MKLKETKASINILLYQLMYDVHKIFTNNGLKYWADGGTLLGAVRHTGIIPWDDDLDIGINNKDIKKFLSLEKYFNICGYSICPTWFGYKVFYTNRKKINIDNEEMCYSFPFLDVILYRKFKDGLYRPSLKAAREEWPKEKWEQNDLFPLREYEFGSYHILGPAKSLKYFEQYYGTDWNEIAYREYDHKLEEAVESVKVKLTSNMRKPAQPIDKVKQRPCVKSCLITDNKKVPKTDYWMKKDTKTCSISGGCYNNFDTKLGVYVINCGMHKTRYEKFKKFASEANLKACRMPCILGIKFNHRLVCKMINDNIVSNKADMTTIEISINMSHYNCWKKLINSCQDYALILEDDIEVKPDFIEKVNNIFHKLQTTDNHDFSVLHLWNGNWADTQKSLEFVTRVSSNITIMKETEEYNAGAAAYIISRQYAEYLMNRFFPIRIPQDIMMGSYPKHGKHLTLKMRYRVTDNCYLSPLLDMECGGEGGTGTQTSQEHSSPSITERWKCHKC